MKLLFAHDHRFKVDEKGRLFSGGSFSNSVFERYLDVCDELIVVGRCETISCEDTSGYNPINLRSVTFVPMENTNSIAGVLKRPFVQARMDEIVSGCDGVICRGSALGNMAAKAARRQGKPYLTEVVGCPFDALWNHGSLLGKLYAPYAFLRARLHIWQSDYTIYVTDEFLQKRYPTKGRWIGCSDVSLQEFDERILERRVSKIQNKSELEPIVLGTIGATHVKYKGQHYVIKALAKLKQAGLSNFQYQLVGDGDQGYLKSVAQKYDVTEQVVFLGKLTHQDVFHWLDGIDVYIQPSKTEGLPRALIEAMSRGLPCLGSQAGGIPELLEEDCLFSITRRTVDEIADLLESLTRDSMERQARHNFEESRKYDEVVLNHRRRQFLREVFLFDVL